MPLTAYLYSQKISAPFLTDNEWNHVKKSLKQNPEYLHFKCCNSPVYARVSKKGLRHFVHKNTDSCNYIHESEDHLLLKLEVYKACQDNGWDAEIEFAGDNFRADVLASNGKHKVVFEIQLTRQDFQTTVDRQRAFEEADIRCAWFFKRIPKDYRPDKFLPAFELVTENNKLIAPYKCNISGEMMPVRECVQLLLDSKIRFREKLTLRKKQKVRFYLFEEECWKCGSKFKAIGLWSILKSKCNLRIDNNNFDIDDLAIEIKNYTEEIKSIEPDIAVYVKRFNKKINKFEWVNRCPECKAVYSYDILRSKVMKSVSEDDVPKEEISYCTNNNDDSSSQKRPHWCIKGPEGFCDN